MPRFLSVPLAAAALAGLIAAPPAAAAAAGASALGTKIGNDMSPCLTGKGPAVALQVTGLKSGAGNLFVRTYHARPGDWLKSRRYIHRIEARPARGATAVCVPLPAAGDYAIAVHHDVNGNRDTDFTIDGAGMSNNPRVSRILGLVPRPPALDKVRFTASAGVTRVTIAVQYI